jgi:CheY-like chemotaxis protein
MMKVLVVEDEFDSIEPLVECLQSEGMEVFQADNGKNALHVMEQENIDWVLTDIVMPEMDGIELLLELKKRWPSIRCIAWSGVDNRKTYLEVAAVLGATNVLQKPLLPSEIIAIIKT